MDDVFDVLVGLAGFTVRLMMGVSEWLYVLGTGREREGAMGTPRSRMFRASWQLGRILFWTPLVLGGFVLLYLIFR